MGLAVALAIEGNRLEGNEDVAQNQDDVGPLMTDDIPLAVVERLGVVRVETGAVLQGGVDYNHDFPGQPVDALERLGKLPGLRFREMIQRGNGHLGMRLQEFGKERRRQAGKAGGLFERVLRGRDHQKEHIASANARKAPTDGDVTCDPRMQGASRHGASPQYEPSDRSGGDDSTGQGARCPARLANEVIGGLAERASLGTKNVGGRDSRREIDAWLCHREMNDAWRQGISVLELYQACNTLFLHKIGDSTRISCTF
jgi:hypothetical protein